MAKGHKEHKGGLRVKGFESEGKRSRAGKKGHRKGGNKREGRK
jgi:hypothetical protein